MYAAPYEVLPVILHVERRSNIQVEVQTLELISLGVYEQSWQGGDEGVYRDCRGHILHLVCIEAVSFSLAIAGMLVNLRCSSNYVILPSGFKKLVASITYSTSELVSFCQDHLPLHQHDMFQQQNAQLSNREGKIQLALSAYNTHQF
jgi:hypothetical protein